MSLEALIPLGIAVAVVVVMMARQRRVYATYEAAQKQVMDKQAESMAVQREMLEQQKEAVRLLSILASRN